MIRVFAIVAVVAAFAVTAAAPASAYGKMHYDDISLETNTDAPTWPFATKRPWWWPS